MSLSNCDHLSEIIERKQVLKSVSDVCDECIKTGGEWLHLRVCQTCGATYCCDSSPHKHATKHFHRSGHPVISSGQPGERWLWCYKDEEILEY